MLQNIGGASTQKKLSSREVAKITGKRHRDVLRSIREQEVAWTEVNGRKFALVEYVDKKGEKRPEYLLDQLESLYISTKFNDYQRAKLVKRWYELETARTIAEAQVHTLIPYANEKKELPVADLPVEIEYIYEKPVRTYTVEGVKLTVVADMVKAYGSPSRAYKMARKTNRGVMKAIKLLDWNYTELWAVDALGRQVLASQLEYQRVLRDNQLKLEI